MHQLDKEIWLTLHEHLGERQDRPLLGTPREATGAYKAREEILQALKNPSLSSSGRSELMDGLKVADQELARFDEAQRRAATG